MCTMMIATGVGIITGVLGSISSINAQQGAAKQAKKQAAYQSELNRQNAELASQKAHDALAQGQKDQEKARQQYKAQIGSLAARFGANNVSLSSGSALDLLESTAETGELNALDIGAFAEREAKQYLNAANSYENQAIIDQINGQNKVNNAYNNINSSIISGVDSAVGSFSPLMSAKSAPKMAENGLNTTLPTQNSTPRYQAFSPDADEKTFLLYGQKPKKSKTSPLPDAYSTKRFGPFF